MIPLTGTGGLFTRLGRLAGILKAVAAHQQAAIAGGISTLTADFGTLPAPIAGLTRAVQVPANGAGQILANLNLEALIVDAARRTLLEMAKADQPNESWDVPKAVAEVIRQMKASGQTVPSCTLAYSVNSSPLFANPGEPNNGDGAMLVSLRQPHYVASDNVFAEQIRASVSDDSELFSERWAVRGAVPALGIFSYDWPGGSGAVSTLTTCDPNGVPGTGEGQTILTDGSFEEWDDSTTPTNWTDVACSRASAAGTVYNEFSGETVYGVNFVGVPSGYAASVSQVLDTDLIRASTVYGIAFRVRLSDAANFDAITTLTIQAELQDANAGTVLTDVGGTALRVSKTWTSHDDDWHLVSGVVITPRRLPAAIAFVIKTGTLTFTPDGAYAALAHVDHACLFPLKYPYAGGPALGIIAGARPWREGDSLEAIITNDRAGAAFGFTWQAIFDRLFATRQNFLYLPTGASPTIGDFLIDPVGITIPPPPPPPPAATGTLSVHVFNDADGDAVQDAADTDAANRLVYLVGPIETSGTTDFEGDVTFLSLPVGSYRVHVALGAEERCDEDGDTVSVLSGATATATRGIEPVTPPAPPYWDLVIQTNRPFRAFTAVGADTYNGYTDAAGNARVFAIDGPETTAYAITLDDLSTETSIWNTFSDPNVDSGTGFVADVILGSGVTSHEAVVNFAVASTEDPSLFGRFRVILMNAAGSPISGRDVTISTYGLTGTTDANGIVDFSSPLIRRTHIVTIVVESSANPVSWKFHNQSTPPYPGPVLASGTGWTGIGEVGGSVPQGGQADGLAIWREIGAAGTFTISGTVTGAAPNTVYADNGVDPPYSAVTGGGGTYTISGLPAGTYEVTCPITGSQTTSTPAGDYSAVVVGPNETGVNFTMM